MKKILKSLLPPFLMDSIKSQKCPWHGDFENWQDASKRSSGYSHSEVLKKVSEATFNVVIKSFPYERDSVNFNEVSYSWPLSTALLNTYQQQKRLSVLDFGGSLGSSYYQNKEFISNLKNLIWTVVEQENFVAEGVAKFQTNQLRFSSSLKETFKSAQPNFILISGVLQYLEKPYEVLEEVISHSPDVIFLDRLSTALAGRDILTIQKVPPEIYKASYPCWFFHEENVVRLFSSKYRLMGRFGSYVESTGLLNQRYRYEDIGHYWIKK